MRGEPMWQNRAVGWTQYLATDPRLSKSSEYPRLHATTYTHAQLKNCIKFVTDERLIIHHFRYYWENALNKNPQDKDDYYKYLNQLQGLEQGKNIWPDER